jgi:septal ring factor EnvC (AmiA/AmiB activator)
VSRLPWPRQFFILHTVLKRVLPRIQLLLPMAVFTLVMVLLPSPHGAHADEIAVQAEKLQQLRERIDEIKHEIESMRDQRDALQGALKKTETEIGSVTAELRQLDRRTEAVQRDIQELNNERSLEKARLETMRASLAQELQLAYMAGRQEQIRLLLSQEWFITGTLHGLASAACRICSHHFSI